LEWVNGFRKEVHVICLGEGQSDASKQQRLADESFIVTTTEVAIVLEEEPQFPKVSRGQSTTSCNRLI